ncbi:MAG: DUF2239 family protein [Thermoanaerobaculia bacterium]
MKTEQEGSHEAWIAFAGKKRVARGTPADVATRVKAVVDKTPNAQLLVFDSRTSRPVELDLRGTLATVLRKLPDGAGSKSSASKLEDSTEEESAARGPGRPRLGVVAREVTLLPRHWNWLASQPGGASVALRKLVEQGLRSSAGADRQREAREAAYRFLHAMAGDEPGFEEASRALFAGDLSRLREHLTMWPRDVRAHAIALAEAALSGPSASEEPTDGTAR